MSDTENHIAPLPRVAIQAFCETLDLKDTLEDCQNDRRMAKAMLRIQDGGVAACLEAYRGAPTPNIIIIEANSDRHGLLASLDELARYCDEGTRVIVVGLTNDVMLYRELMRRGVSEYLIAPVGVMDMIGALSAIYASPEAGVVGRSIAVMGAKGGVGASTIAHNLAFCISETYEAATVLVDLDLPFGTAGLDFNQDPSQGIADAIFAPDRLDANLVDRLLSKCTDHLSIMAAPATLDRAYDLRETDVDGVADILRGTTPYVVYDVPHLWTAWSRRALISADDVVLVCSPDLANLRNAKTILDVVRQARPNDNRPALVLNTVGMPKRPEIGIAEFVKALEIDLTASIAFDPALFGAAANNGQMLIEVQPKSKAVEAISDLAGAVTGKTPAKAPKKSFLDPLLSKLKTKAA
ncbi:MAG: AAA family ATPase [Beijerinckiaceae bacterium]